MLSQRHVVAVVEDDVGMRQAVRNLLSAFGLETELFSSAGEFINGANKTRAVCLLVDIHLGGGISGLEMSRHLSTMGLSFPMIFMTGRPDEAIQKQALDCGCIAFLHKPFEAKQLLKAIEGVIGSNSVT